MALEQFQIHRVELEGSWNSDEKEKAHILSSTILSSSRAPISSLHSELNPEPPQKTCS